MFGDLHSRDKPLLEVGVLGAPGSGKTKLAQALAARALHRRDRPMPRPRRGARLLPQPLAIEVETPSRRYTLLDWRSEAEAARGLLDRFGALAGCVLVASAADRTPALLRRQVWLARRVCVPYILVFLTRRDAAPQALEWLEADVRSLLHVEGYPGDDAPVVAGDAWSALCSAGKDDAACRPIDELLAALETQLRPPAPAAAKPFRMTVEEVSYLRRGLFAVAAGRIEQGRVAVGDRVAVVGPFEPAPTPRVTGLRQFHRAPTSASAGERVGVMLRRGLVHRLAPGHVLCRPGSVIAPRQFEALLHLSPSNAAHSQRPLRDGAVRLAFPRREANGHCRIVDPAKALADGQTARVCIDLCGAPVGVYEGLRFELWRGGATARGVVARIG